MTTPGSGRSTIGVRVRPNADAFVRDLKTQLAKKKVTYWVDVHANMTPANRDVRQWAKTTLKAFDVKVPIGADLSKAQREVAAWRRKQSADKVKIPILVNTRAATTAMREWRKWAGRDLEIKVKYIMDKDMESMARRVHKIRIDADATQAEGKVKKLKTDIEKPAKTKLDLDIDAAERKYKQLELRILARKLHAKVDLEADTKKINAQLALLRLRERTNKLEIKVDTNRASMARVSRQIQDIGKSFGSITFLRSLDLGPFNLGKPTGFVGMIAQITTLAALLPTVVTGIGALSDAFLRLAGAASIVPGGIAGIVASLTTFKIGASQVGEAIEAMFGVWTEGATEQASAARRSVQAQNNYRNAVIDEKRAQEDLADARREALHELRDLNNELRGGVLNEAQAILDIQKAQERLAEGGFESATDMQQAQLDLANAYLNLDETREKNIKTQEKANKANQQGVNGNRRVTDSLEAVVRAQQQAAEAMQAMASSQATGALGKFNDVLAQLSPNAREFVETLMGLRGPMMGFRNQLQDTIFQGLGPAFANMFANLMPIIQPGMQEIAKGLNQNILQIFDTLQTPAGKSIIERILGGTAEAQKAMTGLIDPLVRGFGTLMAAGAEHLPQLVGLMTKLADRFANFIDTADRSGALDKFMDQGIDALEKIAELGINAVKIINDFATAYRSSFGEDFLTTLVKITGEWHKFLESEEGQAKIREFMDAFKEIWADLKPFLDNLPEIFMMVSDAARALFEAMMPLLTAITNFMRENPTLVRTFVEGWLATKLISGFLTPALTLITGIVGGFRDLRAVVLGLKGLTLPAWLTALLPAGFGGGTKPNQFGIPPVTPGPGNKPGTPKVPTPPVIPPGPGPLAIITTIALVGIDGIMRAQNWEDQLQAYITARGQVTTDADRQALDDAYFRDRPRLAPPPGGRLRRPGATPGDRLKDLAAQGQVPGVEVRDGKLIDTATGRELPSRAVGGFTPWDEKTGRPVMLHGKEYIQPADTTAFYGVGAMQAIHERRIPKELLQSFQGGGYYDPNTGQWVPEQPTRAEQPNPAGGPGIFPTLVTGTGELITHGVSVAAQVAQQGVNLAQQVAPAPPISSGVGMGPAPGPPVMGPEGLPAPTPELPPSGKVPSINLFGFDIPLGDPNNPFFQNQGWGPEGAPPGLGGKVNKNDPYEIPFDIRDFGIGPGPPGSGPLDWAQFAGAELGQFGASFVNALGTGLLSGLGLEGLMSSDTATAAKGIASHFLSSPGFKGTSGTRNAEVDERLKTFYEMPGNPPYPGYGNLPVVIDPVTGEATMVAPYDPATGAPADPNAAGNGGLQINTLRGKQAIQANFPWATNVGGVRADNLKWHPMGLALDVMIPGAKGLNDPTPPEGLAAGNQLYAWLMANKETLGIDYILWQVKDHFNHLHVNFAPSGYPQGSETVPPLTGLGPPALAQTPTLSSWWEQQPSEPTLGPGPHPGRRRPGGRQTAPKVAELKAWAEQLYLQAGMPPGEWPDFEQLVQEESSWDPTAKSSTSSAFGLGQFLDTTAKTYNLPYGTTNPTAQLLAMFQYLKDRPDYQGSPAKALALWRSRDPHWYDQGGWLPPGRTLTVNATGKPELVIPWDMLSFQRGGYNYSTAVIPTPPRPVPFPRPPEARMITPPARQISPVGPPAPPPAAAIPAVTPPPIVPAAPPTGPPTPPPPSMPTAPISGGPQAVTPPEIEGGMHVHPALRKGITSTFSTLGNIAATAMQIGAAALGAGGGATFGGSAAGAAALGGLSGYVSGLFQQFGKIGVNVANVGSSFLVGNITGGTTQNAYGVTQRQRNPTGTTQMIDASNNQYGDIYTNNLDEYFRMQERRDAQKAQASLGHWGR